MPNNLMSKKETDQLFQKMADKINKGIQDHFDETNDDTLEFSMGMMDFKIHNKNKLIEELE